MKSEKLYISESTNFNNLNISKDVFKLTCYWDTDNVESFLWRIDSLVNSILDGLKVLRVLDLSNLKGIKQFIFHGTSCKSLYALYLPLSTESVIYGAMMGLAATGFHQAFKKFIEGSETNSEE